jgi:CRISPR-associated protein Csy1
MMQTEGSERCRQWEQAVESFLQERLHAKLDKLPEDDPKRPELIAQFRPGAWIADAARRVSQIQAVTHSLKAIHPNAQGTNLYVDPAGMPSRDVVGSHVLAGGFPSDVVGNAAVLDVYKFLRLEVDARSLLDRLLEGDPETLSALSHDRAKAEEWRLAFVGLIGDRDKELRSHALAKQMYWLVGNDTADDTQYHLLAPLFATSLAQAIHEVLQEYRFGDANKAARAARREHEEYEGVLRDYPALAVRKLGGSKPQNLSQLNSDRGGVNYLLGSLPPQWDQNMPRQLWGVTSVFGPVLTRQADVSAIIRALLRFLQKDPPPNMQTRDRVDRYVDGLIDEIVAMAGGYRRALPAGWTADPRCKLPREEQLWLDPQRAEEDDDFCGEWLRMDWPAQIGQRFGNWLNGRLRTKLPYVGDVEYRHWKNELLVDEQGWARDLAEWRSRLKVPHDIPARRGTL